MQKPKSEAFKRLLKTDDYQLVISDGFLGEYPKELGVAIATDTGEYDVDALQKALSGINAFVQYGFRVAMTGTAAEQTLADNEALIAASVNDEEEA